MSAEDSIVERTASGAIATTVLGTDAVEYYVRDRAGVLCWSTSIPNGPGAQRRRDAAAAEQRARLERL